MSVIPKPYEIYKHFKGGLYQIVAIAEHTETGECMVVYQAMYDNFKIYVRPLQMFLSPVDKTKYPNAEQEFRFELQGAEGDSRRRTDASSQTMPTEKRKAEAKQENSEAASEAGDIDPAVWEFLDADSYEQRLNILAGIRHRVTDEMITTMAIACDVEVEDGDTQKRYESLKNCLLTLERYECNRLR